MSKGIVETVAGAAIIALDIAFLGANPLLIQLGASLLIAGIGTLLTKKTHQGTTVRDPIAPWNVMYGRGKIGGTTVYIESTGETDKYLHLVFVLACHPCESVDALLFNNQRTALDFQGNSLSFVDSTAVIATNRQVNILHISRTNDVVTVILVNPFPPLASTFAAPMMMDGDFILIQNISGDYTLNGTFAITVINATTFSYISGGNPAIVDNEGSAKTTFPDYGDTIHMEVALGGQSSAAPPFPGLLATDGTGSNGLWTTNHVLEGRTAVYLRLKFGGNTYVSTGLPTIAFLIHGKNNIFDPRSGAVDPRDPRASGYTENAALCIADYLASTAFGYKAVYGTEIPNAPLASAANICDESVELANGYFEPRYTCNGGFEVTTKRGEILRNLLTSCAGRITYVGGQFVIWPAAWIGPSAAWTAGVPTNASGSPVTSGILTVWAAYTNTSGAPATPTVVAFAGIPVNSGLIAAGPAIGSIAQGDFANINLTGITGTPTAFTFALDPYSQVSLLGVMTLGCFLEGTLLSVGPLAELDIYDCYVDLTYADTSTVRIRPKTAAYVNQDDGSGVTGLVTNPGNAIDPDSNPPATFASITRSTYGGGANAGYLLISNFQFPGGGMPSQTALSLNDLAGPFQWRSKVSIRDLYNGCKGLYVSPANHWQSSDIPPYAQDEDHGYHSGSPEYPLGDANLAADGGDRRWFDIQLPFTISSGQAQRTCKVELLLRRFGGTGTFPFNLAMYQLTALDVIAFTLPLMGWSNKLLEVSQHRFTVNKSQNEAGVEVTVLGTELDLKETDPSIYEWSASEELSPQGFQQAAVPDMTMVVAPTGVTAVSDVTTASVGSDGVATSTIQVTWAPPTDGFVLNGGKVIVEYQVASSPASADWIAVGTFDPTVTSAYINAVTDGVPYSVRVAFTNVAKAQSPWTFTGPVIAGGSSLDLQLHFIWAETPTGAMDGTNQVFTLSHIPNPPLSLRLSYSGIDQLQNVDYTLAGAVITFLVAFPDDDEGEWLRASYEF